MKKIITILFLALTNIALAQETVTLRLNYEKGANYTVSMKMSQNMGGIMAMNMGIDMSIKITDVKEDVYESEMKFSKFTMDMIQGEKTMSFDSSKSDEDLDDESKMMKQQMGPILEALIYAKGNNLGEVLEIKVEPNIPNIKDIANQSSSVVYPKEAIQKGSSWKMTREDKGMKMDFIYTVNSITKESVMLDISGTVSGLATGKISGKMNVDKLTGIPVESTIDMDMLASGQELKTKVTMNMTKK